MDSNRAAGPLTFSRNNAVAIDADDFRAQSIVIGKKENSPGCFNLGQSRQNSLVRGFQVPVFNKFVGPSQMNGNIRAAFQRFFEERVACRLNGALSP